MTTKTLSFTEKILFMKKHWLTAALLAFIGGSANSQTIFTYGSHKVTATEFLRAYNKNNQQAAGDKSASMREYLQLYINSKLRIQEAYDRRYDTLPQVHDEVLNLRGQIIETYMTDPEAIKRLTAEAFQRSLKDIHAAHIFISNGSDGTADTTQVRKKLEEVKQRLAKGEDFAEVARQLSDDPAAPENGGDLNFITVFTLPYVFENAVYNTAPGKYSAVIHSDAGYHIFKNIGERKALGKLRLQQILLAFPPGADAPEKMSIGRTADSLYKVLQGGGDFQKLATQFSNDNLSAHAEGNMTEVSVGQYDAAFEAQVWNLPVNGITKPFVSRYGYHIVKMISATPVVTDIDNLENYQSIEEKVINDDRWKTAKDFIYAKVKSKAGFKTLYPSENVLWGITDSLVDMRNAGAGRVLKSSSPVLKVGDSTVKVNDWVNYVQGNRYKTDRVTKKDYRTLLDDFSRQVMYQYYREHLEEFNPEFSYQMSEFRDGNMFFEIMQQEVWNKAQSDSVALLKLYNAGREKYTWKESAQAVIFFCVDSVIAGDLSAKIKASPASWKTYADAINEKVVADSSRFELDQIPGLQGPPVAGSVTDIIVNPTDNTATFSMIREVYTQPSIRSFPEARGLVMNDYQVILEDKWTNELKKKYPVRVNEKEFARLLK
ncbi:MAG: hypothetical protein EOO09_11030 [Chitinophagaceae bacterium]|nr:MAG: hypothetical protein EOO09_11030 [Chitinophagaceae bacterium]